VEASTAVTAPPMGGAFAPPWWAYATALLAAFVLAYAIAASGSHPGARAGAQGTSATPQRPDRLRDVVPLPRLAPPETAPDPALPMAGGIS
jgi:hypothetical protein